MPEAFDDFSLLRGSPNYVAETIVLPADGRDVQFRLRELSAQAVTDIKLWQQNLAKKLGCPAEIAVVEKQRNAWLNTHADDVLSHDHSFVQEGVVIVGSTINDAFTFLVEKELYDIPILDAVAGWDLKVPCTPENLKNLPVRILKGPLYEALVGGAVTGVGAAEFFRRRAQATTGGEKPQEPA